VAHGVCVIDRERINPKKNGRFMQRAGPAQLVLHALCSHVLIHRVRALSPQSPLVCCYTYMLHDKIK